jgi:hypothetical protein
MFRVAETACRKPNVSNDRRPCIKDRLVNLFDGMTSSRNATCSRFEELNLDLFRTNTGPVEKADMDAMKMPMKIVLQADPLYSGTRDDQGVFNGQGAFARCEPGRGRGIWCGRASWYLGETDDM